MAVVQWFYLALLALSMPIASRATANTSASPNVTSSSSSIAVSTSLPVQSASAFQIDVVYPIANATYNATNYFPVVLTLQNLRAAVEAGPIFLEYFLAPSVDALSNDLSHDRWSASWAFEVNPENIHEVSNVNGSPFLLVNGFPVDEWFWAGTKNSSHPVSWTLQIYAGWDRDRNCNWGLGSNLNFTIQRVAPTPIPSIENFPDVTNVCAQPLIAAQYNTTVVTSCYDLIQVEPLSSCVGKLNATAVSSVSSLASYIAYPTGIPTTTTMASSAASMSSSTVRAQALVTARPQAPLLVAAGVLGGLHFYL